MRQLKPFENTRVGKRVQPLLLEQGEAELYKLDPRAALIALEKNASLSVPVLAGGALGVAGMFAFPIISMNMFGNPFHMYLPWGERPKEKADTIALLWLVLIGFAPLGISIPFTTGLKNKVRRPNRLLADRLQTRIHNWAKRRYGVDLDESSLNDGLLTFLSRQQEVGASHFVAARGGTQFKLVAGKVGYYLEQHHEGPGEHLPAGSIAAVERGVGTDISILSGEAQMLAQQIEQQFSTLEHRALSTEANYSLNRAKQDFGQALSLNSELSELGEVQGEGATLLAETLSTLSAELGAIIAQERSAALQQLRVQRDYVRDRQQALGSGLLVLPAPSQLQAEALLRSAENSTTTGATAISAGLEK